MTVERTGHAEDADGVHADGQSRERAVVRPSARVILLDADDRVLLVRAEWDGRSLWFTPGGRIEPGETPEAAARRELREESGLDPRMVRWEGLAALRDWTWHWERGDRWIASHEHLYLARLPVRGGALPHIEHADHTPEEIVALREFRWWGLEELQVSGEPTSPACLRDLLPPLIADGCPAEPLAIGE